MRRRLPGGQLQHHQLVVCPEPGGCEEVVQVGVRHIDDDVAPAQRLADTHEEAGVRLGLVLLATDPIVKSRRLQEITEGVANMTGEETYYWYAKAVGSNADRVRRALRLFLADE